VTAPRPTGSRALLFWAIAACLAAGLTLGMVELLARLLDPVGISYYPETARLLDTLIVERDGYRNRPGMRGRFFGASVAINRLGLRERDLPAVPAPGERRILVMGDSFPFGIGVEEEQAIPRQLESILQAEAPPGRVYRTVNLGVVSYNSEQELRQLETVGLSLHPHAVVLLYALNDIEPVFWVFEKRRAWYVDRIQRSYALSLAAFYWRLAQRKATGASGIGVEHYAPGDPRWEAVDRSLTRIHALCRERGLPFVVAVYDGSPPIDLVRRLGAREGFPVVDIGPERDPRWSGLPPLRWRNSAVDAHPNAEGCRMYATLLAERLRGAGLLEPP
jgi:hypothetical protein